MILERVAASLFDENCYVVAAVDGGTAVAVDPGLGTAAAVREVLDAHQLDLGCVLLTHGHPDHVWDAAAVAGDRPVLVPPPDLYRLENPLASLGIPGLGDFLGAWRRPARVEPLPEALLTGGGAEVVPGVTVRSLPAPGHTEGSTVHFLAGGWDAPGWLREELPTPVPAAAVALTGDVVFRGSIGRTDLPGGDPDVMEWTLRTLRQVVDPGAWLLPGHGPATTMAHELATNPYLARRRSR